MERTPKRHPSAGSGRVCDAPIEEWRVTTHKGNYSAFSGYRFTPSDYSQLTCKRCGTFWRTKADYVSRVRSD